MIGAGSARPAPTLKLVIRIESGLAAGAGLSRYSGATRRILTAPITKNTMAVARLKSTKYRTAVTTRPIASWNRKFASTSKNHAVEPKNPRIVASVPRNPPVSRVNPTKVRRPEPTAVVLLTAKSSLQ